jgi:hypothetical protein
VNGLGQSIGALARAIGPALGGYTCDIYIYDAYVHVYLPLTYTPTHTGILWSISLEFNFIFANFIGASLLLVVCQALNSQLPDPAVKIRSVSDASIDHVSIGSSTKDMKSRHDINCDGDESDHVIVFHNNSKRTNAV